MTIKTGCQCFTCRHDDDKRLITAYLTGYIEACNWVLNWAERNNIPAGSIDGDGLINLIGQVKCNRDESGCLLAECPDIENE